MSSRAKRLLTSLAVLRAAAPWLLAVLCSLASSVAQGKVFLSTKEALQLAFPGAQVVRKQHVLDEDAQKRVLQLSGVAAPRSMVFAYEAKQGKQLLGTAYFDRNRVRSKHQLLMVVIDPQGKVQRIEVLAFGEPVDYLPRGNFYAQFLGRDLMDRLRAKGDITGVVGSTLTVHATIDAVRRILATHRVLYPEQVAAKDEPVKQSKPVKQSRPVKQGRPVKQSEPVKPKPVVSKS
jgi:Na+-translocating ferredoxin:NAD+ oxidoreductase subunit G